MTTDLHEVCDNCNADLEPGQIGLCEICQPEETVLLSPEQAESQGAQEAGNASTMPMATLSLMANRKSNAMVIDRANMLYRNGLLAEMHRERLSAVPVRYSSTWTVRRVTDLDEDQISLHETHNVITDDAGKQVTYTCTEVIGSGLTKRQAIALIGR